MEPVIMDSFYKFISTFYVEGLVEEGKIDYIEPEKDSYLKSVREFIKNGFNLIHWNDILPRYYIFREEISGPDSSGYANCLVYTIGFPTQEEKEQFKIWFRNLCKLF